MTAVFSMDHTAFCCSTAVAVSAARNMLNLDTARIPAVSICVRPTLRVRRERA